MINSGTRIASTWDELAVIVYHSWVDTLLSSSVSLITRLLRVGSALVTSNDNGKIPNPWHEKRDNFPASLWTFTQLFCKAPYLDVYRDPFHLDWQMIDPQTTFTILYRQKDICALLFYRKRRNSNGEKPHEIFSILDILSTWFIGFHICLLFKCVNVVPTCRLLSFFKLSLNQN